MGVIWCFVDKEGDVLAKASDKTWEKRHPTSKNQEGENCTILGSDAFSCGAATMQRSLY